MASWRSYVDKEVIFGIRPEDIWDVPSSAWIEEKVIIETKVDFRELMGSETYVYCQDRNDLPGRPGRRDG